MDIAAKLRILSRLYEAYDSFAAGLEVACHKYCDSCCTCQVTATTLEGYYMITTLETDRLPGLLGRLLSASCGSRFRPQLTTNRIAELCLQGRSLPAEERGSENASCPLLADKACLVYGQRPFGCRCFVSRIPCRSSGQAEVDSFVLTVNTVFLQVMEHVDARGCSGNLIDVLLNQSSAAERQAYRHNRLNCSSAGLIPNRSMPALMVPPEHRRRIAPLWTTLQKILSACPV
jgi:hypothetical protein